MDFSLAQREHADNTKHRVLIKTQDYLDVFARFKQKENIEAVERILSSRTELDLFERSQLGMCAINPFQFCQSSFSSPRSLSQSLAAFKKPKARLPYSKPKYMPCFLQIQRRELTIGPFSTGSFRKLML